MHRQHKTQGCGVYGEIGHRSPDSYNKWRLHAILLPLLVSRCRHHADTYQGGLLNNQKNYRRHNKNAISERRVKEIALLVNYGWRVLPTSLFDNLLVHLLNCRNCPFYNFAIGKKITRITKYCHPALSPRQHILFKVGRESHCTPYFALGKQAFHLAHIGNFVGHSHLWRGVNFSDKLLIDTLFLIKHYTTLDGVMEKEDPNNWEFVVPQKLKDLWKNEDFGKYAMTDGKMPVAFLSNNDITGGNSGSPIMNAKGQLIGLAFDGNWESMSSDVMFEPDLQRCINVDIRYVLFIVDKFGGAGWLLDEMKIVK